MGARPPGYASSVPPVPPQAEPHRRGFLLAAGIVTAALAAVPSALRFATSPTLDTAVWGIPLAGFVACFLVAIGDRPAHVRRVALLLESVAAVVFVAMARGGFAGALCAVVAGQAPFLLGARTSLGLVAAQTIGLAALYARTTGPMEALLGSGGFLGFQLFALGAAHLARREAAAREELARVNAELVAAREAFADATRTAERLRIARDLHDTMGHHLTALRLQLELAKNAAGDTREEALSRSSEVAGELLAEVRAVVSAMRDEPDGTDLPAVLGRLAAGVPRPKVALALTPSLRDAPPALAHAIFRFVQEATTNAARHGDAANLWIRVDEEPDGLVLSADDDGEGEGVVREGNGLKGLRERMEALGGSLAVARSERRGLSLRARLPLVEREVS